MFTWLSDWIHSFSGVNAVFFLSAVFGGVLFIFHLILMIVGGVHSAWDAGGHAGVDAHGADTAHSGDSDASFKLLTLRGLTAFFLIFGLVGLAMSIDSHFGPIGSLFGACVAGLIAMYAVAKFFTMLLRVQSSGTVNMNNAIGAEGTVYLTIPAGGTGKVQILIQDHLNIYDAISDTQETIKTGEGIRVTRLVAGEILVVEKL
jgi:hypothetical protein